MARKPMRLKIKKGALHRQLGLKSGTRIPVSTLMRLKGSSNPTTRRRAQFALNARHWSHSRGKRG